MKTFSLFSLSFVSFALSSAASAEDAACAALASLSLPETVISLAEPVPAKGFAIVGMTFGAATKLPDTYTTAPFCRVAGTIAGSIGFEVWLPPRDAWNSRLQAVGGGGLAGVISYSAMNAAIAKGYATASTDTGHKVGPHDWMLDEERVTDYGYRAVHETTLKAKAILAAYYGKPQKYAYFNGCSTGGRQGLMEAQRFPEDYNGVVVGAPVNHFVGAHTGQMWAAHAVKKDPATALTRDDFALINKAVLETCDALDGVRDGVLEDPTRCDFDPKQLLCASRGAKNCLSEPQTAALAKLYRGPIDPHTGKQIYPGLTRGSETPFVPLHGWETLLGGAGADNTLRIAGPYFGMMVYRDPTWDWKSFTFDASVALSTERTGTVLNAIDPDLSDFAARGGKIVQHHGWGDPLLTPGNSVNYFNSIVDFLKPNHGNDALAEAQRFIRLFMVPGVGHCSGGPGTDTFDAQSALEAWVETGVAPEKLIASHKDNGAVTRTRPLCPYPKIAKYSGSGSTDDAANFSCAEASEVYGD